MKMDSNGFTCTFNLPQANKKGNRTLPPYSPVKPYLCDHYNCPEHWMPSTGRLASYFLPVKPDSAMWLDFTSNANKTHDVAVVISVQGINPITGMPQGDPVMIQYKDECPKCKTAFKANRMCETCGYKWPKQNYLCTTSGQKLWIDGFRAADGMIRQYIFTEETAKGVAANIIGEQRVYAIGLAFFTSKQPKPKPILQQQVFRCSTPVFGNQTNDSYMYKKMDNFHGVIDNYLNPTSATDAVYGRPAPAVYGAGFAPAFYSDSCTNLTLGGYEKDVRATAKVISRKGAVHQDSGGQGIQASSGQFTVSANASVNYIAPEDRRNLCCGPTMDSIEIDQQAETTSLKLEIGAGNEINQDFGEDPNNLDYWNAEPEALICINYCTNSELKKILENPKKIKVKEHGFMQAIPVA